MRNDDNISWLVFVPATDYNFTIRLNNATIEELKIAYDEVSKQEHAKTKIAKLNSKIKAKEAQK